MEYKRSSLMPLSVLIVGLALAMALLVGLTRLANVFDSIRFYDPSLSIPSYAQNIVVLSNNRFIVADRTWVYVYRIGKDGKLVFESRAFVGSQPDTGIGVTPTSKPTPYPGSPQ